MNCMPLSQIVGTLLGQLALGLQPVVQAAAIDATFRLVYFVRTRGNVGVVWVIWLDGGNSVLTDESMLRMSFCFFIFHLGR